MDAIYGVTKEMLAELTSKRSELTAKFPQHQAEAEFENYLRSRGLDTNTWAHAWNGWMERFRADPTGRLEAEWHMYEAQLSQKAHFGDVRDMSQDRLEGITLDQYAQITVAISRQGADADAVVKQFGLQDVAHWQRANQAWIAKMGADPTHALSMQYGQLYQKYAGPQFQEQMVQQMASDLARHHQNRDVVSAPQEELTPELCLQKMQSPSRNERWKYAGLYANMADLGNVPDKAAAIRNVTPILIEMIEQHDEHTTSDAEKGITKLWDLGVHTEDVRGAVARCHGRAQERLATLKAAFAPIQNKAVPERVTMQSRIQDFTSLVQTMEDYLSREWAGQAAPAPAMGGASPMRAQPQWPAQPGAGFPNMPNMPNPMRMASGGGFPKWIIAPVVLVVVGGAVLASRLMSSKSSTDTTSATVTATATAPAATATATTPPKSATPAPAAAAKPKKK